MRLCLLVLFTASGTFYPGSIALAQAAAPSEVPETPFVGSATALLAPAATEAFYRDRQSAPAWEDDALYDQLLEALDGLADHGLNPQHYHRQRLLELRSEPDARDVYATDAWFSAAAHMLNGKLTHLTVEPDWTAAARQADLADSLRAALANGGIATSLEQFAPRHQGYRALLAEYKNLRAQKPETIVPVPSGPLLRQGMAGDRVTDLQQRLAQLELLTPGYRPGHFDSVTVAATRTFQAMNNLADDGLVGPATLAALNRGYEDKLAMLRVNLERWRWLPDDLGQRHVRVNIADYSATSWSAGQPVSTYRTIVGRTYRETPVFSDQIEYLIFNPWWEVPASIAKMDLLPLFRNEPELVRKQGYHVLDRNGQEIDPDGIDWHRVTAVNYALQIRQEPGENNALGQVKIMFPNGHNVYMHDTPARQLFQEPQRAFSSGCIRVESTLDMAAWLLGETPGWDRQAIDAVVASGQETRVGLARRIPVYVLYFTAVADQSGGVRYLNDIYQRDAAVLSGLLENFYQ